MTVLHINSYDKGGGAETVFNFTRNNHLVHRNFSGYISMDNSLEKKSDISFSNCLTGNKIISSFSYIFSLKNYITLRKFLKNNEVDIIHLHGFFSSLSPSVLLAIKVQKRKKKIVVLQTVHEFHVICPNSSLFNYNTNKICEKCIKRKIKFNVFLENCDRRGYISTIVKGFRSLISNNILRHKDIIDYFIAPSNFIKNKLVEGNINSTKITVIRNPIQSKEYFIDSVKKNIVCYFGRFSKEKNLQFLINAFIKWKKESQNDFKLLMIGEGEEEEFLKKMISRTPYYNDILFYKFMEFEDLVTTIQHAKYFSMSSKWYENSPMTILEAISLNIIPIVPRLGGMEESITEILNFGGLYEPDSYDSWIQTIEYLEKNYYSQIAILISKKQKLLERFGIGNYYIKLKELYSVVSEKNKNFVNN